MDVALVRWPAEESKRRDLAGRRRPRMLLVDAEAEPPSSSDMLEDWIRLPAADADVKARVRGLEARVGQLAPSIPTFEGGGSLEYRLSRIELTPLQERLLEPLVDRFGAVVSRQALENAGWPHGTERRNTLDVHVVRLRRRLSPLGLEIRSVRSRGYFLADGGADL